MYIVESDNTSRLWNSFNVSVSELIMWLAFFMDNSQPGGSLFINSLCCQHGES